jgi:hypothetical protein
MEDEMRLPIFRGDGFEDPNQHWFLYEALWNIKSIIDEAIKRTRFNTCNIPDIKSMQNINKMLEMAE